MIAIASDHAGFKLKTSIIEHLKSQNIEFEDFGTFDEESIDYPDFAYKACMSVVNKSAKLGILVCGTGIGMCIAANKIKNIRAALCFNEFTAQAAREHNDANVLCVGERTTDKETALKIVDIFIKTPFLAGRHKIRVDKMMEFEKE